MCHWLTIAVAERGSLAPVHELGVNCAPAEHPMLPAGAQTRQRWLVTTDNCACSLWCDPAGLADALTRVAMLEGVVFVHRTFGDMPRGGHALAPTVPASAAEFVDDDAMQDRWVRLVTRFTPDGPVPSRIDGARTIACAGVPKPGADGIVVLAVVQYQYVPGVTRLGCSEDWQVVHTEWFADDAAARAHARERHGALRWVDAGGAPQ